MMNAISRTGNYLLVLLLLAVMSCDQTTIDKYGDYGSSDNGTFYGQVTELDGSGLALVKVSVNEVFSSSDSEGYFQLLQVPAGDTLVVAFELNGYASTFQKAFVEKDSSTLVKAAMAAIGSVSTIDASQSSTVNFQGAEVYLQANSLVDANGNPYTGNATVEATYFDPTATGFGLAFPGDFVGEDQSGNDVAIESFGFITVEISDGTNELNLASGSTADISIPIPQSILGTAPDPIPLWYFDEETGTWMEEGSASIQNGKYVGVVGHFSSWNADLPLQTSKITGRVVYQNGAIAPNAEVFLDGVTYSYWDWVDTDAAGRFTFWVKANETVEINAETYSPPPISYILCESNIMTISTAPSGQTKDIGDVILICPDTAALTNDYYDGFSSFAGAIDIAVGVSGKAVRSDFMSGAWKTLAVGTDATLYGVYMAGYDYRNTWIVGSNGTVKNSLDFGDSWTTVGIGTSQDLMDVEFAGPFNGLIVGELGAIFISNDAGTNWISSNSGTVETLHDADFPTLNQAWAVGTGGTIIHSSDGGQNWNPQNSGSAEDLFGVCMQSAEMGWVVGGNGTLVKTVNGGQNWQRQNVNTMEDLNGVDFTYAGLGKIVGDNGVVLTTTDDGQNWTLALETPMNHVSSIRFGGLQAGIITGDDILNHLSSSNTDPPTTSGWIAQTDGVDTKLNDLLVVSTTEAWVVGDQGVVLHTVNSGSSWTPVGVGSGAHLASICGQGIEYWIAGSGETILHSSDGGNSWQEVHSNPGGKMARNIQMINNIGWALFSDPGSGGKMLKTMDGGLTWTPMDFFPNDKASYFTDFTFLNQSDGFMIARDVQGDLDYQFSTTDGGISWQDMSSETQSMEEYNDLFFIDDKVGWRFASLDVAYATWNGGQSWTNQLFRVHISPMKGFFIDYLNGWGVSKQKQITGQPVTDFAVCRTKDGGESWYFQLTNSGNFPGPLSDVEMANEKIGWAIGGLNGFIYYTNTGGD